MGILEAILAVFTAVGEWITTMIPALEPIFWTAGTSGGAGSLTFMGVLSVCGLAFSVVLLIFNIISSFLRFST